MEKSFFILINGLPGSGKTKRGRLLSEHYKLPLITRDAIKEQIFDDLGWSDRDWSRKAGIASYHIMDKFIIELLKAGNSFIAESDFKPEFDNEKFKKWVEEFSFLPIQVMCWADGKVLYERFKHRVESGERHPGHVDKINYTDEDFKNLLLKGKGTPLDLNGPVLEIDTTDLDNIDQEGLVHSIDAILKG